ncbi:hypothetical protein SUDANB51_03575 [Streptomyces sp. enrichment culture]
MGHALYGVSVGGLHVCECGGRIGQILGLEGADDGALHAGLLGGIRRGGSLDGQVVGQAGAVGVACCAEFLQ